MYTVSTASLAGDSRILPRGATTMTVLVRFHRRQCFVAFYCLALVAVACSSSVAADDNGTPPEGLRVFYTGHSFHMFVPPRVEQMVAAAGIRGHKLVGSQS